MPALLAAGGVLLAGPATALELGEVDVHSALGQPLRASIAYALGPNEQLAGYCIYLRGGRSDSGLPVVSGARASVDGGRIVVSGSTLMREPMMSLQLTVDCPYTPHLRRDYLLMLNPGVAGQAVAESGSRSRPVEERADGADAVPVRRRAAASRRVSPRSTTTVAKVAKGTPYRVQPGDTLSGIAERIPDRRVALWPAVDALFAANPDAFIGGNPDRLKAGVLLTIPEELAVPTASSRAAQPAAPAPTPTPTDTAPAQPVAATAATDNGATTPVSTAATPAEAVSKSVPAGESHGETANDAPVVPATENVTIPDTRIDAAPPIPVVGNHVSADDVSSGGPLSWLMWLGGTGIAIILGLLLFGRSVRERVGGSPAALAPQRRRTDRGEAAQEHTIVDDLQDTISRAQVFEVDANLSDGSGFDSTPDIDVAQEFNFGVADVQSAGLDLAFDENSAHEPEQQPTDMISPMAQDESVIVDREVLPSHDEDEGTGYDLSMVVDATRQNFGEADGTTHDLHAIEVETLTDDSAATGTFTLNEEAGYRLIEQDYEDELTATQILNKQMEDAARELSESLDAERTNEHDDGATAELPGDTDKAQDSMAEDLEGTAEVTTSLPATEQAVNDDLGGAEITVEMPADQNEATVEMGPDRARQRKSKAS